MVLWIVAGMGLFVALLALWATRRLGRKLETLTQSYWELRYDYTRLRSVVSRLDPGEADEAPAMPEPSPVTFVPLSSMKKKNG